MGEEGKLETQDLRGSGGWELLGRSIWVDCAVIESERLAGTPGGELLPYLESRAHPHPCPGDWEPHAWMIVPL